MTENVVSVFDDACADMATLQLLAMERLRGRVEESVGDMPRAVMAAHTQYLLGFVFFAQFQARMEGGLRERLG